MQTNSLIYRDLIVNTGSAVCSVSSVSNTTQSTTDRSDCINFPQLDHSVLCKFPVEVQIRSCDETLLAVQLHVRNTQRRSCTACEAPSLCAEISGKTPALSSSLFCSFNRHSSKLDQPQDKSARNTVSLFALTTNVLCHTEARPAGAVSLQRLFLRLSAGTARV